MPAPPPVVRPAGPASAEPLCERHDVALLDLDGVVYRGPRAVPGAVRHLQAARARGLRLGYVTNNASRPPGDIAAHLRELGLDLDDVDVVTSAQAAARVVAGLVPGGARVLVVGGPGLEQALVEHALEPVRSLDDAPAAVVQGFHRTVGWEQLAEAAYAVAQGLPWVASNLDATVPTPRGRAPGNGTLVAAVQQATGAHPVVAGKPEPALVAESVLRTSAERPLMVGDRLDTDVRGASRAAMPSLLVLTGVTSLRECLSARGDDRATYVAPDLGSLLVPHPTVGVVDAAPGEHRLGCSSWTVDVRDGALLLSGGPGPAPAAGETPAADVLAAVRVLVAAGWLAHDTGHGAPDATAALARVGAMMEATAPAVHQSPSRETT